MHPWASHGDDEGGQEAVDDDDKDRQDEGPPPRGSQRRRAPLPLAAASPHFPPRGPEVAEHAVVVGEDAEGDEQDEVAEYEEAPEEPVDHVVTQHLQEEGRADDGEHDVGAVGDVWVPVVSNETKDWFIGALLSSKSY